MAWLGVKLRMVALIEGVGATDVNDGVFVVWASRPRRRLARLRPFWEQVTA